MGFFRALGSFRYMKLLPYLPFLEELRQALLLSWGDWELLATRMSDILFRVVNLATGGLAASVVAKDRMTTAVSAISRAVISLMAVIEDIKNGTEPLHPEPPARV